MKTKLLFLISIIKFCSLAQQSPTNTSPAGIVPSGQNNLQFWSRAGNNGFVSNLNNIFGTMWNSPIYTITNDQYRMKLNGVINYPVNGFAGQRNGYLLLGYSQTYAASLFTGASSGAYDFKPSKMGAALHGFYKKKFLFLPNGGYDLVDVRDLSASIVAALELGKNKEIYLLSGKYYSFKELGKEIGKVRAQKKTILILPNWILTLSLPFVWLAGKITRTAPSLTKEAIVAITEGHPEMNNEKARLILHHKTRPLQDSLRDVFYH